MKRRLPSGCSLALAPSHCWLVYNGCSKVGVGNANILGVSVPSCSVEISNEDGSSTFLGSPMSNGSFDSQVFAVHKAVDNPELLLEAKPDPRTGTFRPKRRTSKLRENCEETRHY